MKITQTSGGSGMQDTGSDQGDRRLNKPCFPRGPGARLGKLTLYNTSQTYGF